MNQESDGQLDVIQRVISAEEQAVERLLVEVRRHSRLWWLAHLMVVPMLVLVLMTLWLATGSRSIPLMTQFIEGELNRQAAPIITSIDDVRIKLDASRGTLVAQIRDVRVRDPHKEETLHFPALEMRMVTRPLLRGRLKIRELGVLQPVLNIQRDAEGGVDLRMSAQEEEGARASAASASAPASSGSGVTVGEVFAGLQRLGLKKVNLHEGKIRLIDKGRAMLLQVPLVTLSMQRGEASGTMRVGVDAALSLAQKGARVHAQLTMHPQQMDVQVQWEDLPLAAFAPLHPRLAMLAAGSLQISGAAQMQLDAQMRVQRAQLSIMHGTGELRDAQVFADGLTVNDIKLRAHMADAGREVVLDALVLKSSGGAVFEGNARAVAVPEVPVDTVAFSDYADVYNPLDEEPQSQQGYDVKANLKAYRAQLDDLKHYWPALLAPMSRAWVMNNLSAGVVPQAQLHIHLTPEMLAQHPLPSAFLSAAIQVENASVRYLSHMPAITGVSGVVRFTGNSMDVEVVAGKTMQASVVKKALVSIPDFFNEREGIPLVVDASLTSDGRDIATAIDKEHLHLGESIQLRADALKGSADGRIQLKLPLYSDAIPNNTKTFDELVEYQVEAALDGVTQDKIQGKWDIDGLKGSFAAKNGSLNVKGDAKLSGVPLHLDVVSQRLQEPEAKAKQERYETRYHVTGAMTPAQLKTLGVGELSFVSGVLGVDAQVEEEEGKPTQTKGVIDLADALVEIPVLAWKKVVGVPASVAFTHQADEQTDKLSDFVLRSSGVYLQGEVDIRKKDKAVSRIALSQFRYGRSDLNVDYTLDTQGVARVVLRGAVADATPWVGDLPENEEEMTPEQKKQVAQPVDDPIKKLVNMDVNMDVARLEMGRERMFEHVKVDLSCRELCQRVDVRAVTKGGVPFTWDIHEEGGKRVLRVDTKDAGEVAHVLGVSAHVHNGQLEIRGSFDDAQPDHPLQGNVLMQDFSVTNAPILTRLLSLMSLSGLTRALTGEGIEFTKMAMNLGYADGALRISEGKAHGSALGFTLKGTLQPFAKQTNIEGTLVPAYAANSILGNIPVLGTLLTGGEGGGIIAANFSIKGNSADPSVRVNPLSLLTPGFLRKLFDIAD
jgi:hypothetical protein